MNAVLCSLLSSRGDTNYRCKSIKSFITIWQLLFIEMKEKERQCYVPFRFDNKYTSASRCICRHIRQQTNPRSADVIKCFRPALVDEMTRRNMNEKTRICYLAYFIISLFSKFSKHTWQCIPHTFLAYCRRSFDFHFILCSFLHLFNDNSDHRHGMAIVIVRPSDVYCKTIRHNGGFST